MEGNTLLVPAQRRQGGCQLIILYGSMHTISPFLYPLSLCSSLIHASRDLPTRSMCHVRMSLTAVQPESLISQASQLLLRTP